MICVLCTSLCLILSDSREEDCVDQVWFHA